MQKRGSLANPLPRYGAPSNRRGPFGSSVGSALVSLVIAAVLIAIGYFAYTFIQNVNRNGDPVDAPAIAASIRNGDSVLINQRIFIRVEISSGNPITDAAILVDDSPIARATPAYDDDRGLYVASLPWTPGELGLADVRIVVRDDADRETARELRVDVTDDPSQVAAGMRLSIVGIVPLQNVALGRPIRIRAVAQSDEPVTGFELRVNDAEIDSAPAQLNADGQYSAVLEWTPAQLGAADIEVRAASGSGGIPPRALTVTVILSDGGEAQAAASSAQSQQAQAQAEPATPSAYARFTAPRNNSEIPRTEDLALDAEVEVRGTGPLSAATVYITPILADGTYGASAAIWSRTDTLPANGNLDAVVPNLQQHFRGLGWYELEVVAVTAAGQRFDQRVRIQLVEASEQDEQEGEEDEEGSLLIDEGETEDDGVDGDAPEPARRSDGTDIQIASVAVSPDAASILVDIVNVGSNDLAGSPIQIRIADADAGGVLIQHPAAVTAAVGRLATISVPIRVDQTLNIFVVVELPEDVNLQNNSLRTSVSPPDPDRIDLALSGAAKRDDGTIAITVANVGDASVSEYDIRVSSGEQVENIRRSAAAPPLQPGADELLITSQPHAGTVRIVLDPSGRIDQNRQNNSYELAAGSAPDSQTEAPEADGSPDEQAEPVEDEEDEELLEE